MADTILADARAYFEESQAASSVIREAASEDISFARLGKQWPELMERQRELEGRPCLVINGLPAVIRQVVNDARQNKPGISVHPVDGGADYDTAEVIGGLLRAIERNSNAGVAYDTAIDNAVTCGLGFFRIEIDYAHAESFDMEATIKRIANPLSVHWDTASQEVDASDWRYAFVSDYMPRAEFKKKYPKASMIDWDGGWGDRDPNWGDEDNVRLSEYWQREEFKKKIYQFQDGSVFSEELALDAAKRWAVEMGFDPAIVADAPKKLLLAELFARPGMAPTRERMATGYKVIQRLITGVDVLEESIWPGTTIPICPVWGEEVVHEGIRYFRGLIRDARGPQMMKNFWRSAETELVALAPKTPFIMEEGQIPDDEAEKWQTANTRSYAYLMYKAVNGAPPPQRQPMPTVPAGAVQAALNASDDIKQVTGIYDASLGARGNETSGRAISARQRQSDNSTFHFIDNLSRAIQYAGRCLVEVVGSVYSERQAIQILGKDMAPQVVKLTQENGGTQGQEGEQRLYNLSVGRYDVTVQTGPAYATQREETRAALMELVQGDPEAKLVLGDLILKNMDFPEADEAAKRIQMLQQMKMQQMMPPQPPMAPPGAPQLPPPQAA